VGVFWGENPTPASQDACRMEHVLSPESFAKIKEFYAKLKVEKEKA